MKKFFVFAVCLSISLSVFAEDIQLSVNLPRAHAGKDWISILKQDYNPQGKIDGSVWINIIPSKLLNAYYSFPAVTAVYSAPPIVKCGETEIASFLKSKRKPNVIIRLPEKLRDAKFVGDIEMLFMKLGWQIIDRNLIANVRPGKTIKSQTGADLIIDVSWLKFSDPEMYCKLDKQRSYIGTFYGKGEVADAYMLFEPRKKFDKWKNDNDRKHIKYFHKSYRSDVLLNAYSKKILSYMMVYDCFNTNKNVVSAVFKFTNAADGSLLGYYHVGEVSETKISGGNTVDVCGERYFTGEKDSRGVLVNVKFNDASSFYRQMHRSIDDLILLSALSYIDVFLPNKEMPFAAQLNEMEDVKLTDDRIIESWNSSSNTSSSYSGRSRDRYSAYFNSRYYQRNRNGHYSGDAVSSTDSYGSGTTTFKNAEYIRYSDFFGYYKPLTEKLIMEMQTVVK